MAKKIKDKKKNPVASLLGGLIMTIILVVVIPAAIGYFIAPIVNDVIGTTTLDSPIVNLTSGAISALVLFMILVVFMLLLGGGAIVRRFGIIGIIGLIIAYVLIGQTWGWVVPVIIVVVLSVFSYSRERKKKKKKKKSKKSA